ncbi:MAG: hypothetical protein FWC11_00635 [Firmicutes bacterium]|nr:hypothetical protein [Bacillota bacterium]
MKTKRKITGLMIVVLAIISTSLFSFFGCSARNLNEDDFRLTLEVSQTEARVGDVIVVTATFENLSGRDIPVRTRLHGLDYFGNVNNVLQIVAWTERTEWIYITLPGRPPRTIFQKDAFIKIQRTFVIREQENYIVQANAILNNRNYMRIQKEISITICI